MARVASDSPSAEDGAKAASVVAALAATSRNRAPVGRARTAAKSAAERTARAHRRRLAQPVAAVAPTRRRG
jgi:hypothetical protein